MNEEMNNELLCLSIVGDQKKGKYYYIKLKALKAKGYVTIIVVVRAGKSDSSYQYYRNTLNNHFSFFKE